MQTTFYLRKYFLCFFNFFKKRTGKQTKNIYYISVVSQGVLFLPSFLFSPVQPKMCPTPPQGKRNSELYETIKLS